MTAGGTVRWWWWLTGVLLVAAASGTVAWTVLQRAVRPVSAGSVALPAAAEAALGVACTGWIEPEQGVINVAAAPDAGRPPIVTRLLVREGEAVRTGQALAELNSAAELAAAADQAAARVQVARRRMVQVQAGVRPSEVAAQRAEVARLEHERQALLATLARQEALLAQDYIARAQVEATQQRVQHVADLIAAATLREEGLVEVRGTDVDLAAAEVRAAEADLARARAAARGGLVRAPQDGLVLRLRAHPGEAIGAGGLLELAPAGPMTVLAEVYETDIARVRIGQQATITAEVLAQPIEGRVVWVRPALEQRQSPSLDPAAFSEGRVFHTRIAVRDSRTIARLIHAKVNVLLLP